MDFSESEIDFYVQKLILFGRKLTFLTQKYIFLLKNFISRHEKYFFKEFRNLRFFLNIFFFYLPSRDEDSKLKTSLKKAHPSKNRKPFDQAKRVRSNKNANYVRKE